jgi:hypothetical protein
MGSGQILEVRGIVGEIRAIRASGDRAEVFARKRGDEDDFHQVAVEVAQDDQRVIVCALYGSWKHGRDRCHPDLDDRDDEERHRKVDMDVEVDFEVRIPAGVDFQGALVSGGIEATGLRSDVWARTVNGRVEVATSGLARASSVSGDIDVEMGGTGRGRMEFNTVSGDITLRLPADFSADVSFSSLSGSFDSDFSMEIHREKKRWVGHQLQATVGEGGRELSLQTVSGNVEILRARR